MGRRDQRFADRSDRRKDRDGFPPRDAISLGLLAMDYEKDSLDTPRIVTAVSNKRPVGYLGIIRKDALLVREFTLVPAKSATSPPTRRTAPATTRSRPASQLRA